MLEGVLRRSEAPVLTREDISREADVSGRLTVRRSKTDPEREGKVLGICPDSMDALTAIQRESDSDSGPVIGPPWQQIIRCIAAA